MSSIRFSADGDNVSAGTRKRKSKRRTSILKSQSPSRTALSDLDPNAAEQKKVDTKSSRRSSKRVSFADTFQVQEFWTEHHAKELGLWDTSRDSTGEQSSKQNNRENADSEQLATSGTRSEVTSDDHGANDQQEPANGDVSVGPGHRITGLETLLTGQIRNTDLEDNLSQSVTTQQAEPEPEIVVIEHPQSSVQDLSSQGNESKAMPLANTSYISQTNQPEYGIENKQPGSQTEIHPTRSCSESTSESDEQEAIMVINKKHSRRSLTMVGAPNYLCRMPSNDSTMSVSMDPSGHQYWAGAQHSGFNISQGAADMDLTGCQMSFNQKDTSVHVQESPDEHTDNRSFFQQFMGPNQASGVEPWTNKVAHSEDDDDVFVDDEESPEEKIDNRSFFQQFMHKKPESTPYDMKSAGVESCSDSPAEKLDSRSFLASLMGGNSSKAEIKVPPSADLDDKTQIFGDDETTAEMELTTCIGGMQASSSSNRRPLQERIEAIRNSDMTVRFGDYDNDGDMELTTCYGANRQPALLTRMPERAASGKADATQMFDQSGVMDFTTCIGGITGKDHTLGTCSPTRNTTRFTTTNMTGLSFMNKTYSNVTLDNTTTILRDIDSALGLKRKSNVPPELLHGIQAEKVRRNEGPHESTRVFADFVPRMPGIREDDAEPALSPIKKEAGDNNQVICGEETAAIEFTGCIKGAGFTNIQQINLSHSAVESTRIFQAEDTAGMDFTTCIGSEELPTGKAIHGREQLVARGDRTRVFSAEDSGEMEMTECHGVVIPEEMSSLKPETKHSSMAGLDGTKIFRPDDTGGMELTTCVDNLIVRSTSDRESTLNKTNVTKQSHSDMDKTKVFQADDTCGMEFTACIDNLIVRSSTNRESAGNTTLNKTNITKQSQSSKDMDKTKVYQADDTCGMEFTACVDNLIVRNTTNRESVGNTTLNKTDIAKQSQSSKDMDKTKVYQADDTCGMEFTACIDNLIVRSSTNRESVGNTTLNKTDIAKQSQSSKDMDKTKVYQADDTCGMEFTACIDNLIVRSSTNRESVGNTTLNKTDIAKQSQPDKDMDMTKIYQPDDTCGMEFTTCIGNILPNTQSATATSIKKQETKLGSQLEPTMECTKIYRPDETFGMELTTCVGSMIESNANASKHSGQDRTRMFGSDDTAKMEMTACLGQIESQQSSRGQENVDCTRVFSEENGNMEMTECIDSHVAALQQQNKLTVSMNVSARIPDGEVTKVFTENTAKMDMTECIGGVLATTSSSSSQKGNSLRASVSCANQEEHTQVFADIAGGMEMTECIGGMIPATNQQLLPSKPTGKSTMDQTRLFMSENTAKMDMTECVGGLFPEFTCKSVGQQNQTRAQNETETDGTRVFSENTAKMDMTECVGGVFPSAPAPNSTSAASISRQSNLQTESEHTTVFSENTAKMEMTECVGSVFPTFAQNSPADKHPENSDAATECTRVFSENTGKMDMTECVGTVFPSFASNTGKKNKASVNKSVLEHTAVFSEDTGKMDFTECIGGVFPSFAPKPIVNNADEENKYPVSQASTLKHSTVMSGSESYKSLESEEIPDAMQENSAIDKDVRSTLDCTQTFSGNDGGMEMTECVSLNDIVGTENSGSKKSSAADVTKIFSEHTARMEITECVGNVYVGSSDEASVVGRSGGNFRPVADLENLEDRTKVFSSENTAKMDMTECVGTVLSTTAARGDGKEEVTTPTCSKNSETADVESEVPDVCEQPKEKTSGVVDETKRHSDTYTMDTSKENIGNESKRSSDTFTISNTSTASSQKSQQDEGEINQKDGELRKSDTFTIDKPLKEAEASEATQPGQTQEMETQMEGNTTNERLSSVESYTGDGIMEEETLVMDNTEEFDMMPGFSALLKKGLKEPDVTTMDIDCQLSMDVSALEASGLAPSSTSQSSSPPQAPRAMPRLSQSDKSALTTSVLETNTLPTTGPVPMEEFLDFLSIAGTLPKGRRSMMEPISVAPPETLGDFLELSLITHPKHQMFEWANEYLASSIEKMRESIKEQEARMSKHNPAIVKELQHATPERSEDLRKKVVTLHGACKKSVKNKFREWRKKMSTSTLESLKKSQEELESSISTVCSSAEKIEDSLKELEQYDSQLDSALSQLESTALPTEEEQQKYLLEGEQLEKINQEVVKLKETIDVLEKQKVELKDDAKVMQAAHEEMKSEEERLACHSSVPQFDQEDAVEQINRTHRLQEWTLEEYKHEGCRAHFTFLEGSLSLVFKLGNKIGTDKSVEREITDVSIESLLADDSCIAAKVANTMALRSVDVETIKRQTPTTKTMPQVLQQLSSRLCPARLMYDEVANIAFWHQVSFCESRLTVEFSSLEAYLKFYVTFELTPGAYPMKPLHHTYRHKIGQNMESQLQEVLSSVKPGWDYLSRLIASIESLIQSKIPKQQEY